MLFDVGFNLVPVALIISNLFTFRADGQEAAQGFNLGQGFLQLGDEMLAFAFQFLLFRDIFKDDLLCKVNI